MAEALNRTTGGLSTEMNEYYEKVFLARAKKTIVLAEGAQKSTHGKNNGKSIVFNRKTPMSLATTALSEGANPAVVLMAGSTVSCTLAEYGNTAKISKFLTLTGIDKNNEENIDTLGQNMGETINRLTGNALSAGLTASFANAKKASTIKSSDTLDLADIRTTVQNLETAQAMRYKDGFFIGKVQPVSKTGLMADSTWLGVRQYSQPKDLYNGEIGEVHGVRFLLNTSKMSAVGTGSSSTVTTYYNFIHGSDAFGTYDLEGDQPKLYILTNPVDSNNPTGRYSLISWAGSYVAKVLNSTWGYSLRSA
jgi:N4-gp56 family major capsid protein